MELRCTAARAGRLLGVLRGELGLSSTLVKRLKTKNAFYVNGAPAFTDHPVRPGDEIRVLLAEPPPDFPAEPGPLEILYEDEALLVLDKPPGLPVHPTASRAAGTLANRTAAYYRETGQACGIHPVTRLDRDTFGVSLLAKNAHVHALLSRAQREGRLEKIYLAAASGGPDADAGVIDLPIARRGGGSLLREVRPDGQPAVTAYRVLSRAAGLTLLELRPETGRTHQLRVHCAASGFPILGDRDYGGANCPAGGGQQLCAVRLRLFHPLDGRERTFTSRRRPFWPEEFPFYG